MIVSSAPSPYASLRVANNAASTTGISATTGAGGTAVYGYSDTGTGVFGLANNGYAVIGSSAAGEGVRGYATTGKGVYAWANGTGYGLHAKSGTGFGAMIESAATGNSSYALWATNTGGGTAAHFDTAGVSAYAVWASNNASSGGTSILTQGFQGGDGIVGMTDSGYTGSSGRPSSSGGTGVYRETTGTAEGCHPGRPGPTRLLHGRASRQRWRSQRLVSRSTIPSTRRNKYLSHSFVECPDMKNVYDGIVVLDAAARRVELPEWFEALNRDFRYQLTCIGALRAGLRRREDRGNRFRIAGGTAGSRSPGR